MPSITNIHANAPSTTNNCAQCHGAAAPSFAIPAANFSIVGLPANHIRPRPRARWGLPRRRGLGSITALPVVDGARFSGSRMSHAGITNNCAACPIARARRTSPASRASSACRRPLDGASAHIPSGTTCEHCHLGTLASVSGLIPTIFDASAPGTLFATPAPTGRKDSAGVTSGCAGLPMRPTVVDGRERLSDPRRP